MPVAKAKLSCNDFTTRKSKVFMVVDTMMKYTSAKHSKYINLKSVSAQKLVILCRKYHIGAKIYCLNTCAWSELESIGIYAVWRRGYQGRG